jgi:uncharacterized damage-inducible protein DinB
MEHGLMTKQDFLAKLREGRAIYEAALARVPSSAMEHALTPGGWSVKDIVAHVVWSEQEMIGMLRERSLESGSELWELAQDERNRQVYERNKERALDEVLSEGRQAYADLLAMIDDLSDEELNTPEAFEGMPPDWLPWRVLAGSTYKHYLEHADDLHMLG